MLPDELRQPISLVGKGTLPEEGYCQSAMLELDLRSEHIIPLIGCRAWLTIAVPRLLWMILNAWPVRGVL